MNKLIEKIEAPLKENPDLSNPPKGSYQDGYRSATINILTLIKAENLPISGVSSSLVDKNMLEPEAVNIVDEFINEKGIYYDFKEFVESRGYTLNELGFIEE